MSRKSRRGYITESNSFESTNGMPGFDTYDFDENLEMFLQTVRARNRSSHTVDFYRNVLRVFRNTLEKQGLTTKINRITSDMIERNFIAYYLDVRKLKYSTVATKLRGVRAFFNWAVDRGILVSSPMEYIVINNPKHASVETYTRDQIRDILGQPNLETFVGFRDYTIMIILLETGVRVRELSDIKLEDVRWSDYQILIHGKNGDDRLVPFQVQAGRVLKRYLKARGKSPVDYLFISREDTQFARKSIQDRIRKYGRMANITNVRNSPHTFRHTFAKMSVRNGANLFDLQKILGHKTLDMVRVYVNLFSSEVAESHRKFSPIENLRVL